MPDFVIKELWQLIPTVVYFLVGLVMFGFSVWIMDKVEGRPRARRARHCSGGRDPLPRTFRRGGAPTPSSE